MSWPDERMSAPQNWLTGHVGSGCNIWDFYPQSAQFCSLPGHRLSWLRLTVFVVFLNPSNKSYRSTSTSQPLLRFQSFPIYCSSKILPSDDAFCRIQTASLLKPQPTPRLLQLPLPILPPLQLLPLVLLLLLIQQQLLLLLIIIIMTIPWSQFLQRHFFPFCAFPYEIRSFLSD
jgi:hypothetical protein